MNTRHAQIILAIVREGSFTAAAKALFITQPTLSQTVRQIEAQLGEPIFVRGKTPVSLTPAGELFAQAARRTLQIETQLEEAIRLLHGRAEGMIRLGLTPHRSEELLPHVLPDFWRTYPNMQLDVLEAPATQLEQMLLRSELDMALFSGGSHLAELEYRQIASEEIVLLAGRGCTLSQRVPSGSTVCLREAENEVFILPHCDSPMHRYLTPLLETCGFTPKVGMRCPSVEAALHICTSCNRVTLSPFISLLCDSNSMQKLSHYHLTPEAFLPPFYMAYLREQPLSPCAETLFTMLSNRFRSMTVYHFS